MRVFPLRVVLSTLRPLLLSMLASATAFAAPPVEDSGTTADGFTLALAPRPFEFPRDHGAHPDFRHEWWYVTGNLDGPGAERIGFELTIFRFALAPPEEPAPQAASHWRTRQIYMAHFAISDVPREKFWFKERYARGAVDLAGAQASPFRVWLEDWSLEEQGATWRLHAAQGDYALTLDLKALTPPVLNGEKGLRRKAGELGAASYYYSLPRMSAQGTFARQGTPMAVKGLAWLDREWGSDALALERQGWDWFAIQMRDGSALMFYSLRNRDGSRDPHSAGTWVAPNGATRALEQDDVELEPLEFWTSPRGGRYPSRWQLSVASLALTLDIRPVMADQELNTSTRYWEGAVDVQGRRAARPVAGRGYVELVGYAR